MTTVYAVSSGEYSDYSIDRVFTTRELAEAFIDLIDKREGYGSARVEEWEVHDEMPEHARVWTKSAGLVADSYPRYGYDRANPDGYETPALWFADEQGAYIDGPRLPDLSGDRTDTRVHIGAGGDYCSLTVTGTDLERVRHVFNDRRAQLKIELDDLAAAGWTS